MILQVLDGMECIYHAPYYYLELNTARMLHDLNLIYNPDPALVNARIDKLQKSFDIELDEMQRLAVEEAARCGLFILTGGPGTGKTTTINAIIRFFEEEGMDILLVITSYSIHYTKLYDASSQTLCLDSFEVLEDCLLRVS